MCLDVTTAEVTVKELEVNGIFKDNVALLNAIKKLHETDTFKCVAVTKTEMTERLYGMLEADFIKMAKVLPPRTQSNEDADE